MSSDRMMSMMVSRGSRRLVSGCIAGLLGLGILAGCQKTVIASSVSPCFRILPQAHAAVGGQGTFVDVARLQASALPELARLRPFLRRRSPTTTVPGSTNSSTTLPVQRNVCLVAYKGTFDTTKIPLLRDPASTGQYAIVFVGITNQRVRAVVLVAKLPAPLHAH
jgi:hypothetical protein